SGAGAERSARWSGRVARTAPRRISSAASRPCRMRSDCPSKRPWQSTQRTPATASSSSPAGGVSATPPTSRRPPGSPGTCPPSGAAGERRGVLLTRGRPGAALRRDGGTAVKIVAAGMVSDVPGQGGATWAVLQYVLGLRRLGHDVVLIEPVRSLERSARYFR